MGTMPFRDQTARLTLRDVSGAAAWLLDGLPDQSEGLGVDGGLDMVGPGLHEVEDGLDG
jgi:hypothetical protein